MHSSVFFLKRAGTFAPEQAHSFHHPSSNVNVYSGFSRFCRKKAKNDRAQALIVLLLWMTVDRGGKGAKGLPHRSTSIVKAVPSYSST
jgi:hypothetical protein